MEVRDQETSYMYSEEFQRSEKFEINDIEFVEIRIDSNRLIAKGKTWTTFELLLSFIGAAWMEKWRRFGSKMLAAGIILLLWPFFVVFIPGMAMLFYGPGGLYFMLPFMMLGVVFIMLWALVKREAVRIYTPAEVFKLEGSAGFVEAVWNAISSQQRSKNR